MGGGSKYLVDILDDDGFTLPVDLLNDIDLALIPSTHDTNLVAFSEEDVLPTQVLGDGRRV